MNEDYEEFYSDSDLHTSSDSERVEVDYQKIEEAFYNALNRVESEKLNDSGQVLVEQQVIPDSNYPLVEFATPTDSSLMTCKVDVPPASCVEQSTAYLLDIRNILFLFLSVYFILTSYSKIKSSVLHLYKARS